MKCPKCSYEISKEEIASYIGSFTSEKKKKACQANGKKPCHEGKKRGWIKGKPRKIILEEQK